jgi:chromosome segregation ATPase
MNRLLDLKTLTLAGVIAILLALNLHLQHKLGRLDGRVDQLETQLTGFRKTAQTEFDNLAESSTRLRETSIAPKAESEIPATPAVDPNQVREEAAKRAEQIARRLTAAQQKKDEKAQQQLRSELAHLKEVASSSDAKLNQVRTQVVAVQSEVAANESKIDHSIMDLRRVLGDLGVESGRVATNRKELDTLKALGDRNYFDFDLRRDKTGRHISDVSLLLKRTDPKKNKFTLEVLSNDKRVEKKDRNLNEPVQFYVSKAHPPYGKVVDELYELVVNEVRKDEVVGYLTTPKQAIN